MWKCLSFRSGLCQWNLSPGLQLRGNQLFGELCQSQDQCSALWGLWKSLWLRSALQQWYLSGPLYWWSDFLFRSLCRPDFGPGELWFMRSSLCSRTKLRQSSLHQLSYIERRSPQSNLLFLWWNTRLLVSGSGGLYDRGGSSTNGCQLTGTKRCYFATEHSAADFWQHDQRLYHFALPAQCTGNWLDQHKYQRSCGPVYWIPRCQRNHNHVQFLRLFSSGPVFHQRPLYHTSTLWNAVQPVYNATSKCLE